MDIFDLLARVVVSGVLVVAGVGKVLDPEGSRRAMTAFGVPRRAATLLGRALPVAEVLIAGQLLFGITVRWAAMLATLLFLAFTVVIAAHVARGQREDCHCFGMFHSAPSSWRTVARNAVLTIVSASIVLANLNGERTGVFDWVGELSGFEMVVLAYGIVATIAIAGLGWIVIQLWAQHGRMLLRLDELEASGPERRIPGVPAPGFELQDLDGTLTSLGSLLAARRSLVLLFSDPGCVPCQDLLPQIAAWQADHDRQVTLAVISRGSREANLAKVSEYGIARVLLQADREVSTAYDALGTPSAVMISPSGMRMGGVARGGDQIRAMIEGIIASETASQPLPIPARPPSLAIGTEVPPIRLPDLDGNEAPVGSLDGRDTVVLLWNPECGYCRKMEGDLNEWSGAGPKLLVVSTGTVEANREQALDAPVLLDDRFRVGNALGARGTPSAILVDGQGRVASELVVGGPAVMELLARPAQVSPIP